MEILNSIAEIRRAQLQVNPGIQDWLTAPLPEHPRTLRWLNATEARKHLGDPRKIMSRTIRQLHACGSFLHLREWLEHDAEVTLHRANFCRHHLLCRTCAARRAGKTIVNYMSRIQQVMAEDATLRPCMITLTVRNGEDLGERFSCLYEGWRTMTTHASEAKRFKRGYEPIEWNKVLGFVRAGEVTNKGKGWHPHYHILALVRDLPDKYMLAEEWKRFTHDGSFVVDVRWIENSTEEALFAAMREVLKYSVKFGDLSPAQIAQVWTTMRGTRFTSNGGVLRGVPPVDDLTDDDLSGPYRDYYAVWLREYNGYKVTECNND